MPKDNNSPNTPIGNTSIPNTAPGGAAPPVPPPVEMPFSSGLPLNDSLPPVESQVMANMPNMDNTPPVGIPPLVSPPSRRGLSGGKIVGAILGLLLLVGGIGAGVLLVQQNQDIREKAAELGESCSSGGQSGTCLTLVQCGQQNGTWLGTVGGCTGSAGCCAGVGGDTDGSQCSGATAGAGGCVPNSYSCTNSYGQMDCPSGQKCGVSCQSSGNCSGVTAGSGGCVPANWSCNNEYGQQDCGTGNKCGVSCTSNTGGGTPGGSCGGCEGGTIPDGYAGGCNPNQGGKQGFCRCDHWEYEYSASCPDPSAGGNPSGGDCRYVNDGNTVSLAGDCSGYTFRSLLFECDGSASAGQDGKCEPGYHDGYLSTITDSTGATSINIGSVPACRSRQADLIVVSRPNDGLSGDELPGTPRVANFIIRDGDQSNCAVGGQPSPSTRAQCGNVVAYDTNWNQLSTTQLSALKAGDKVRFTITGTKTSGAFTKARFKVNQNSAVETILTKPGANEVFYTEYTVPSGVTSFQVGAAIYHDSIGWIPNLIN